MLEIVGKKKKCELVGDWVWLVLNYLYWCVLLSDGDGELVFEKWLFVFNYIIDVYEGYG